MPSETQNGAGAVTETVLAVVPPRNAVVPTVVKPVEILLDRPRSMVMDFAAMEAFEEATGLSAWGREAWDGSPKHTVALIWSALLHEDPELTLDQVKRMPCMTLANVGYLSDRLADLWGVSMPDADADAPPAEEGTGDADPNPRSRRAG